MKKNSTAKNPGEGIPILLTTKETKSLKLFSEKVGVSVADFVRMTIKDRLEEMGAQPATSTPCPFCNKTDRLNVIQWTHERPDQTEYNGEAVQCDRCDVVASFPSWMKRSK